MQLTKAAIVAKVRLLINESKLNEGDFDSSQDEADLEATIGDRILEALRFVNVTASSEMLVPDKTVTEYTEEEVNGVTVGKMFLPDNYLRLVKASAEGWAHSVDTAVLDTTAEWKLLFDKYVSGGLENPKVGIRRASSKEIINNTLSIGSFSAFLVGVTPREDEDDPRPWAELNYMEDPEWKTPVTTGGLQPAGSSTPYVVISPLVADAFYYYLSGLVLSTLNDERAQSMASQALSLLGVQQAQEG